MAIAEAEIRPRAGGEGEPPQRPTDDEPIARYFIYSGAFWLALNILAGIVLSVFLYSPPVIQQLVPDALKAAINFGRLRPFHVWLGIFGWVSMVWIGSMLYLTCRLTRARLAWPGLARTLLYAWNGAMLGAAITFPLGYTQGREYAELTWPLSLLLEACFIALAAIIWRTVAQREEPRIFVSVWLFMISSFMTPIVYAVGNKLWDPSGAYTGMNDAIINYFYVHNLFNAWFTTAAFGLVFYMLPRFTGNKLYSHRLAMWGFTSVWTGQHHALYSPAPDWLQIVSVSFSILTVIPNAALLGNWWFTMKGAWSQLRENLPLRWLTVGMIFYLFTCLQGVAQSFRTFNSLVHLTNWVVGHSHLAFVADYSFFAFGLIYYLIPRMVGRPLSLRLRRAAEWHFWVSLVGITAFMYTLWFMGLEQGRDWAMGVPFVATVRNLHAWFFVRLLSGVVLGFGQVIFLYVFVRFVTARKAAAEA